MKDEWLRVIQDENEEYRIAHCGKYCMAYFDPAEKKFVVRRFYCGKFNRCAFCLQRRVKFFAETLRVPGMVWSVTVAEDDRRSIEYIKKSAGGLYTQFPREDGMVTFFTGKRDGICDIESFRMFNPVMIDDIPLAEFEYICTTPAGRRVTGYGSKTKLEVAVMFGIADPDTSEVIGLSLNIPYINVMASAEQMERWADECIIKREVYPEDYSETDTVGKLQVICMLRTRLMETVMRRDGARPKMKQDVFQFLFPAHLFSKKAVWVQEDVF